MDVRLECVGSCHGGLRYTPESASPQLHHCLAFTRPTHHADDQVLGPGQQHVVDDVHVGPARVRLLSPAPQVGSSSMTLEPINGVLIWTR